MKIDLQKLVRLSDFKAEDKKRILEGFETLPAEAKMELWGICLENLLWKIEFEFSKRFHETVFRAVKDKKDNTDYLNMERDIILEVFTKADVETREEEITALQKLIKSYKGKKSQLAS